MDVLQGGSDDPPQIEVSFDPLPTSGHDSQSFYSNIEPDIQWTRVSTRQLIEVVSGHLEEFYDKTVKKKVLWKKVANEMREMGIMCSPDECDKKWRNLKKTYVTSLIKQTKGDFSTNFYHFDQIHAFLGKEIDPLGLREQAMKLQVKEQEKLQNGRLEIPRMAFFEVAMDDKFEWTDSAVYLLLDTIVDHKELFEISPDIDTIWENIASTMKLTGHEVSQEQCQRKWINLIDGFKHYQAEAEATGCMPTWNFFNRVRLIMNAVNVPVTQIESKISSAPTLKITSAPALKGSRLTPTTSMGERKRQKWMEESECEGDDPATSLRGALSSLERHLDVDQRLKHLETKVELTKKQMAAAKHSNALLSSILSTMKQINKGLEARKRRVAMQERMKPEELLDGNSLDDTPIVDEEAYQQTLFNMSNFAKFHLMKTPKVEILDDGEPEGITVFVE